MGDPEQSELEEVELREHKRRGVGSAQRIDRAPVLAVDRMTISDIEAVPAPVMYPAPVRHKTSCLAWIQLMLTILTLIVLFAVLYLGSSIDLKIDQLVVALNQTAHVNV